MMKKCSEASCVLVGLVAQIAIIIAFIFLARTGFATQPMECTVMDVVKKGVEVRCDDGTWLSIPRYSFAPEPAYEGQTVKMEWVDGQLHFSTDK